MATQIPLPVSRRRTLPHRGLETPITQMVPCTAARDLATKTGLPDTRGATAGSRSPGTEGVSVTLITLLPLSGTPRPSIQPRPASPAHAKHAGGGGGRSTDQVRRPEGVIKAVSANARTSAPGSPA